MPTVLIVENHSLVGASIESLLVPEPYLNVIGVTPGDEATLIKAIWHLQPDVIILNEASHLTDPMNLLAKLRDYPRLRVVMVSAYTNLLQIYDKQEILTLQANNLANLVRRSYDPA